MEYAPPLAFIAGGVVLAAGRLGTAVEAELNGTANCIETGTAVDC